MFYSGLLCLAASHVLNSAIPASARLLSVRLWLFGLPSLVLAPSAFAAPVTLQWAASTSPQLAGYKVYYGHASRQYSVTVDVGTSTTASFSSLQDAQVYYFAVTAYNTAGKESTFSNEVSYDLGSADTDKDGLSDWDEIDLHQTDPDVVDTDGDGLSDGDEIKLYDTDPTKADTDGDGIPDSVEVNPGSNPPEPTPIPPASSVTFAVNAGGPQYTTTGGSVYVADMRFSGGSTYRTTATIAQTADPSLYQSERYGNFSYAVPVDDGDYIVMLRFAEIYWSNVGRRVFDVEIEGVLAIDNLDLFAKVGKNAAYDVAVSVRVTDGTLNIGFRSVVDAPKVSAIEILQAVDSP
jgi:hypothetical protein